MIISDQDFGLQLVRQDLHMLHAGRIAAAWGNRGFAKLPLHESFAAGVRLHDNGWDEFDDTLPFAAGRPVNFLDVDLTQHASFYERGYRRAKEQDDYAGLLIGMHWIGLYTRRYGYDPTFTYAVPDELTGFMASLIARIETEIQDGLRPLWTPTRPKLAFENEVWFHYELMQVIDRLSLFMCLNVPGSGASVTLGPLRRSPEDHEYLDVTATMREDGTVTIDPFPFPNPLVLDVDAWRLPRRTFTAEAEYRELVLATAPTSIANTLVPAAA